MDKNELEKKIELAVLENWDRDHLDSYDVWKVLRVMGEEFVYNLIRMREALIDYHRDGKEGFVHYAWMPKADNLNAAMASLCDLIRDLILKHFLQLRVVRDSDIWEVLRNLERQWMVGELNEMTRTLEQCKRERIEAPQTLYSADEILSIISDYEQP